MSTAQNVLTQALQLTSEERADVAHQLLLSLESEPFDEGYEAAWENEVIARVKKLDDGTATTFDWREAHEEIRSKLREKRP